MKEILETIVKEELAGAETEALKEGVVLAACELDEAELAAQEAPGRLKPFDLVEKAYLL